jgi:NADH-quinone oxidoreductase subunit N
MNTVFVYPLLLLSAAAILTMLLPRKIASHPLVPYIGLVAVILSLVSLIANSRHLEIGGLLFQGTLYGDSLTHLSWILLLLLYAIQMVAFFKRVPREGITRIAEYHSLTLFSLIGALTVVSAAEFLTLFIGIELLSLPVYVLCASALWAKTPELKRGAESALKYLLLGAFGSALLLFGIALLFGVSGSTSYDQVASVLMHTRGAIVGLGLGLVLMAALFKVGAAPFHFWVPDVYQGAPTSVTSYMGSVVKATGVLLLLRLIVELFAPFIAFWSGAMWTAALLSVIVGNLLASRQRSVKRLLAYSSVAQVGYILCGMLSIDNTNHGGAAILYYVMVYALTTVGIMSIVHDVSGDSVTGLHPDDIAKFNGLASSNPAKAFLATMLLLTLAGLPPALGGFFGKAFLFSSAIAGGYIGLVALALCSAVIGVFYYLRIVVAMYFVRQDVEEKLHPRSDLVTALCVALVLIMGIFPSTFIESFAAILASMS